MPVGSWDLFCNPFADSGVGIVEKNVGFTAIFSSPQPFDPAGPTQPSLSDYL